MDCPTFENILDFADGRLAPAEVEAIEGHVAAGCDECATALAWYRQFSTVAEEDASIEPPTWVTNRAVGLFADARDAAARRGIRGLVARIRAALVLDTLAGDFADAIPARSAGAEARQLLYSASTYDVDLLVAPFEASRRLLVSGQVLVGESVDFGGVGSLTVELDAGEGVVATTTTSEFGEFSFRGVEPGFYDIRIAGDGREILLSHAPLAIH